MVILHISDTHGWADQIPPSRFDGIDLVIHSGDEANYRDPYRNESECRSFIDWYSQVPVKHKIFVAGNHSTAIERRLVTRNDFESAGIIYLENSEVVIDGLKFWGSPYTPTFNDWAFMRKREKMHALWASIPDDTDVLITHGPPKGIRDLSFNRDGELEMCGCTSLMKRCWALRDTLKLVCFGHIHNMDGVDTNAGISQYSNSKTIFSNAACIYDGKAGLKSFGNICKI